MKNNNSKILLACSYGPDSMALFHMLLKDVGNTGFEVAHVNYHLRKESNDEMKGLKEYCKKKKVKIHLLDLDEKLSSSNLEAKCRKIRYEFFQTIYKEGFKALYVAHNQDDLIETYLLQKQRRNIVEFYGIKEKSKAFDMNIVRPLLDWKKSDLMNYCKKNKVPFAIDKTNLENTFQRNKIRHEIVEKLSDQERKEYIALIDEKNKELKHTKDRIKRLDLSLISNLMTLNDLEFVIALNMLVKKYSKETSLSKNYCLDIKKALASGKPNLEFKINLSLTLVKSYGTIQIIENDGDNKYSYILKRPGILDTNEFYLDFTRGGENRNVYLNDYPITIRTANPNDTIKIKNYSKTARRLFIDWKMPQLLRKKWPVIVNNKGEVIYIPRYQKNFKVDENTNFYVK